MILGDTCTSYGRYIPTILYTADALISGLIAVGVLFLFCMCCFYFILPITIVFCVVMCLSGHWGSQTATRVQTTTRGTVVSVADLEITSSTQQQPTSSTTTVEPLKTDPPPRKDTAPRADSCAVPVGISHYTNTFEPLRSGPF